MYIYRVSQYTWDPYDNPITYAPFCKCTYIYICLNIHGTHVTANNSTNNNVVFFFLFEFENSIYYNNY